MILVILALLIIAFSFFLAYKSMKDYTEAPSETIPYGLYLIRNPQNIREQELINKLLNHSKELNSIFSFEHLQYGNEIANVVFMPRQIASSIPFLNLLELEDYVGDVNSCFAWEVNSLVNSKEPLKIKHGFFSEIELGVAQGLFFQVVCQVNKKTQNTASSLIRIIVSDKNTNQRIELVKKINNLLMQNTNFNPEKREESTLKIFSDYKSRLTNQKKNDNWINFTNSELLNLINELFQKKLGVNA